MRRFCLTTTQVKGCLLEHVSIQSVTSTRLPPKHKFHTIHWPPLQQTASWCNGGWIHDASCNGYAQALEAVMAFTPAQAGLIPFASPWYPLKPACPFPGCPMIPDATKVGYGSNGQQIDQETGTIYGGRFDDMVHWAYQGGLPDGDRFVCYPRH